MMQRHFMHQLYLRIREKQGEYKREMSSEDNHQFFVKFVDDIQNEEISTWNFVEITLAIPFHFFL